jgi:hypothetical protein
MADGDVVEGNNPSMPAVCDKISGRSCPLKAPVQRTRAQHHQTFVSTNG